MSTSYYNLKEPVTRIRVLEGEEKSHIIIDIKDSESSIMAVRNEHLPSALKLFFSTDDNSAMHTYFGGSAVGVIVRGIYNLPEDHTLLSENGELVKVSEVRAMKGKGKKDE